MEAVDSSAIDLAREQIRHAKRVVVKIGSNVLVGGSSGIVNRRIFCSLVEELATLDHPDRRMILVSSGAIAVARRQLNVEKPPGGDNIARKQALAAIGQPTLMNLYTQEFALYRHHAAQVLISPENFGDRDRFLNARNTLRELISIEDVITIINENDTTSTAEIRFGDNDNLAALTCSIADADLLIILSDIDGLYTADPSKNADAKQLKHVWSDDPSLKPLAAPVDPTGPGSGGMGTKIKAARVAGGIGVPTIIAPGRTPGVLRRILAGEEIGTLFVPRERVQARKTWLAFASLPAGRIVIDDGAAHALLHKGKSLLSIGVREVVGEFELGSPVEIFTLSGREIARGLANYPSRDLAAVAGMPSESIVPTLGYTNGDAVVHRDDLVLTEE